MFVVNKWDMIAGTMPTEKWVAYLRDQFRSLWYAPIAFVTGQTGKNVKAMLNHCADALPPVAAPRDDRPVEQAASRGVGAESAADPPESPPEDLLRHAGGGAAADGRAVLQRSEGDSPQYQRYLLRVFRESLDFGEVPIKLYLRRREHDDKRDEIDAAVASEEGPE